MTKPVDHEAEIAIRQLEVTALNFAYQATNIASVRAEYTRRTQELTANLRAAYQNGEMSAKAAAQTANEMRNRRCGCAIPGQGVRRLRTGLGGVATNIACRATLIRLLDEGWTTSAEAALIGRLRSLR